jgi:hypothetical protein
MVSNGLREISRRQVPVHVSTRQLTMPPQVTQDAMPGMFISATMASALEDRISLGHQRLGLCGTSGRLFIQQGDYHKRCNGSEEKRDHPPNKAAAPF